MSNCTHVRALFTLDLPYTSRTYLWECFGFPSLGTKREKKKEPRKKVREATARPQNKTSCTIRPIWLPSIPTSLVYYSADDNMVLTSCEASNSEMKWVTRFDGCIDVTKFILRFEHIIAPDANCEEQPRQIVRYLYGDAFDHHYETFAPDCELIAEGNDYCIAKYSLMKKFRCRARAGRRYPRSC